MILRHAANLTLDARVIADMGDGRQAWAINAIRVPVGSTQIVIEIYAPGNTEKPTRDIFALHLNMEDMIEVEPKVTWRLEPVV